MLKVLLLILTNIIRTHDDFFPVIEFASTTKLTNNSTKSQILNKVVTAIVFRLIFYLRWMLKVSNFSEIKGKTLIFC